MVSDTENERTKLLPSHGGDSLDRRKSDEALGTTQSSRRLKVDDILNFIGFGPFQIVSFCLAAIACLAFGVEFAAFAFIALPLQEKWELSGLQYATFVSITGVANIIGAFVYAYLCDNFGRVWPYTLVLINIGAFGLASAFAPSYIVLIVLRFCASIGVGGVGLIVYPTLLETLPVYNRGKVVVLSMFTQAVGNCVTGGLAWWLIPTYEDNGWRYLLIAISIPCFFAAAFRMMFSVQSPRFLLAHGRFQEAKKVFELMARFNGKKLEDLLPEGTNIQDNIDLELQKPRRRLDSILLMLELFKSEYLRHTLFLSVVFITETSGYYGSSLFLPGMLSKLGISNPYFVAFVGYLGQIPGILFMSIIVEWKYVGRMNSLRFFTILTVVTFLLLAFVQSPAITAALIVMLYFSMYPIVALVYTYGSESYPTEMRSIALGYFTNITAVFAIAVPFLSGYAADVSVTWLYPTVWAGMFLVQLIAALFLKHETRQVNLIDTIPVT